MTESKLDPSYNKRPADPNFVDVEKTPLHERAIAYYLNEAWKSIHGEYPARDTLSILWSQVVLETGRNTDRGSNSMMRNFNYGNIKKNLNYSPNWTSYEAGEFLKGKHHMFYPYHPQTLFAAWLNPLDGAIGYLKFLKNRKRYAKAWIELEKGNPVSYVMELKKGGYFTAPLEKYTEVVVKLTVEFNNRHGDLMAWAPPPEPPKEQPVEVTAPEQVPEPEEKITALVPEQESESKLEFITRIFYTAWTYLMKAISYFKK